VVEAAVADAVVEVEAAQQVEQLQPACQQAVQLHRPEHRQQTRVVDVEVVVADAVVTVALPIQIRSRHFADPQLNRGFHFSRGRQRSTITTRPMR
jgi:hypothetical protein